MTNPKPQSKPGLRIGEPDFVFDSQKRRIPRRIVRLAGDDESEVEEVLAEFTEQQVVGSKMHAELQRFAHLMKDRTVALEWQGNMGWVRYATCRH